jgi:hypothetical protein
MPQPVRKDMAWQESSALRFLHEALAPIALSVLLLLLIVCLPGSPAFGQAQTATARISIDAGKVEGRISPLLYGQFAEFMFENIKGGLYAGLIRNRSFEEAPNVIGLSRHWERYPDDRNDDYALNFRRDEKVSYPVSKPSLPSGSTSLIALRRPKP